MSDLRHRGRGTRAAIGGGGLGILGLVAVLLFNLASGGGGGELLRNLEGATVGPGAAQADNSGLDERCRTGADVEEHQDCRIVATVNSVQDYWRGTIEGYELADTHFFRAVVDTACGRADSSVGPFYCPADQGIYIDLDFYQDLRTRFGAQGGAFAEAYVIAHEYGHHVQNLLGTNGRVRTRQGPDSDAVRLELQADCYAGVWANNATTTPSDLSGEPLIEELTDADIAAGLDAASRIGDDTIQRQTQGRVTPESWTHGSSEQRQRWFTTGFRTGDPFACDTFAAAAL